jgi:2-haloacid dehalogenase
VRVGILSNFSPTMLTAANRGSKLETSFEQVLSTDRARTYKPDPRAYQLGVDAFHLPRERIAFAAFAGWDAAGARRFGYHTFWVNRAKAPAEELGASPDASGTSLAELVAFISARR